MKSLGDIKTVDDQLQYLEENLDERHIENTIKRHKSALSFEPIEELPKIRMRSCGIEAKSMEAIHSSIEDMLFNELIGCINSVISKDASLPMIRANYGVGTLASLFGLKNSIVNGNMPWVTPLESRKEIEALIERGVPDLDNGFGRRITETHNYYKSMLARYPKCNRLIKIYHPDLQGPFDDAHLIWGSDIYVAMYDDEVLFNKLMELVTDTYIKFLKRNLAEADATIEGGFLYHWGTVLKGGVALREDSSVNVSRDMYINLIQPYNRRIAESCGGATMHFCGRADQWVRDLIKTPGINAVNFGYMEGKFDNDFLRFIKEDCFNENVPVVNYKIHSGFDYSIFKTGITLRE